MDQPLIRIGLPYSSDGRLAEEARRCGGHTMISMGSLFRDGAFTPIGMGAWTTYSTLDSGGFVAMMQGGYRWSVQEHVQFVVTNSGDGEMPFPWQWWAQMDFCVEPQIAANRAEVERRIALTVSTYAETLIALDDWRDEGVTDIPDPIPVLQGRTPEDYVACARAMAEAIDRTHRCSCPLGDEDCSAEYHRAHAGLPAMVGVGSMCRRPVRGPEGLLAVISRLDRELPPHVKLHLFGVKGQLMTHLAPYVHRIASVDSMAWDYAATQAAKRERKAGNTFSNTVEHRSGHMRRWMGKQQTALAAAAAPVQPDLFAKRAP